MLPEEVYELKDDEDSISPLVEYLKEALADIPKGILSLNDEPGLLNLPDFEVLPALLKHLTKGDVEAEKQLRNGSKRIVDEYWDEMDLSQEATEELLANVSEMED